MKIIYILNSGQYGGMEQHVLDLTEGMLSKGHEVHVWCPNGPLTESLKNLGAIVVIEQINLDIDTSYISKLIKYLKKNNIEIIHAHELKAVTNALLAGFFAGVKIRIAHTHTPISEWKINPMVRFATVLGYSTLINLFATYEIALTSSRQKVKRKEGIWKKKLKIIKSANVVRTNNLTSDETLKEEYKKEICARYNITTDFRVWGYLGRISEEKGLSVLLEAYKGFLKQQGGAAQSTDKLIIAGGGPLQEIFKQQVKDLDLDDSVIVTGRFADEDKKKFYSTFDVFIHPSLAEGFGIVLVESIVSKIPVIASDIEVFKEVAGDKVLYFKSGDSDNLTEKMLFAVNNPEVLKRNVSLAYEQIGSLYTLENFTNEYETFYKSLLTKNS